MSVLVIDVGTSSVRAAVVRADLSVDAERSRSLLPSSPAPGLVEFDPAALAATTLEVAKESLAAGGSLSHHHGVGLNRSRFVSEALGAGFGVLRAVKAALDPTGILNPGKLGLPSPFGPPPWP